MASDLDAIFYFIKYNQGYFTSLSLNVNTLTILQMRMNANGTRIISIVFAALNSPVLPARVNKLDGMQFRISLIIPSENKAPAEDITPPRM